ncbi:MAG: zinc finger domain-containing protein [Candidatus Nanoarchaeia archaeon]
MKRLICNSCKKEIINERGSVRFKCPNCGDVEIIRCEHCRSIGARYKCSGCEFEGPN